MSDWSLTTVEIDGVFVAAVRRPDATYVVPEQLRGYAGLGPALDDWADLAPALRDLDVDELEPVAAAKPVAPIHYPRKIVGGGPNYTDHMEEMAPGRKPPVGAAPFFYFVPPSTTMIGEGETVLIPSDPAASVDWEAELAVVIGRPGRDIAEQDAFSHVAGYACFNDITARGWMVKQPPLGEPFAWDWATCKGLDTFCPMGAVTPEWFVPDPQALDMRCLVNGVVKQDSTTKNMVTGVAALIAEASKYWTLEPGDVLNTGTPAGVGFRRGERLTDGDEVRVEIGNLAPLTNPVRHRR